LIRVRAWVKRFIDNCRLPREQRVTNVLTVDEISDQETTVIVEDQRLIYSKEYNVILSDKTLPF